jgi:hypothetical protein
MVKDREESMALWSTPYNQVVIQGLRTVDCIQHEYESQHAHAHAGRIEIESFPHLFLCWCQHTRTPYSIQISLARSLLEIGWGIQSNPVMLVYLRYQSGALTCKLVSLVSERSGQTRHLQ